MFGGKVGSAPKVIMLDSSDCFAVDALQIEAKHFRSLTALAYELEQYLPLDAERMAIGIIASGNGLRQNREEGLIVLADRESLEKSIFDVETQGIWVAGVTPKFLLGCQFWCQENGIWI